MGFCRRRRIFLKGRRIWAGCLRCCGSRDIGNGSDGSPRRAAISGFGFGGINAHVLIEEWGEAENFGRGIATRDEDKDKDKDKEKEGKEVAIVGMGARFGPWQSLGDFRRRVFGGDAREAVAPRGWWGADAAKSARGFFVEEVKVPVGRFRVPPAELAEMLPQQLLMLQVAADALEDARLGEKPAKRLDTGVFIGIGLDLNTTNFRLRWTMAEKARRWEREMGLELTDSQMAEWVEELRSATGPALTANRTMGALGGIVASRVARAFHVGGPSFTVSSEETSALDAIGVGAGALLRGEIDVALVGAVDLAGDLRWANAADEDSGEGRARGSWC